MADVNNTTRVETPEDLRGHDREKNTSILAQITGQDKRPSKKSGSEGQRKNKHGKKKGMPVVIDIIVAILMLAMVGALVAGGYYLFRYFSDDYETVDVTYTFVIPPSENFAYINAKTLVGRSLFSDADGNTHYFGKIKTADEDADGSLILSVEVTAKYRSDEGYLIDGLTLAVGTEHALRTDYNAMQGTVVRLDEKK